MHRLFVAIRPPAPIRDLLIDAMDDSPGLRWQDDEQLHLTLRFVGEVERPVAEDLADSLSRIQFDRFTIRLAGVGQFEQRSRGALWTGVEPRAQVAALAAKIERACVAIGLAPERRAFHPHVTVARWGRGGSGPVDGWLERRAAFATPVFEVDNFTLFESHLGRHGPHYEAKADYPLG